MEDFNKNDKQHNFCQIKGKITEIIDGEKFGSVTLEVGHEKPRSVNLILKKTMVQDIQKDYSINDKVCIGFYISSKNKEGKWRTMANVLFVEKEA
ncbi:MAG: hypothetical protein V4547_18020 [Bacteroidota bacterium]